MTTPNSEEMFDGLTAAELTRLLFVSEPPDQADLAMIFGASFEEEMLQRTRQGIRLYVENYVPRLLVTGGGCLADSRPELPRMADVVRDSEVPHDRLLVEASSKTTFENVEFSCELLREMDLLDELRKIILISSEWHMQRVRLTVQKYFPSSIRLLCCPTLEGFNRHTWTKTRAGRQAVEQEALLLTTLQETGAL